MKASSVVRIRTQGVSVYVCIFIHVLNNSMYVYIYIYVVTPPHPQDLRPPVPIDSTNCFHTYVQDSDMSNRAFLYVHASRAATCRGFDLHINLVPNFGPG